jgi:hypothetical protein
MNETERLSLILRLPGMRGWSPPLHTGEMTMTNLNNDTRELNLNELDAVTGAGAIVDAIHYAQLAGELAVIYSRPAVETETTCSK